MKTVILILVVLFTYGVVGTSERVDKIKKLAPSDIESNRGWTIMRYEGYQHGSFGNHGGKVWYHVKDNNTRNTYYRVYVTLWGGELHYAYGSPEKLDRINIDYSEH